MAQQYYRDRLEQAYGFMLELLNNAGMEYPDASAKAATRYEVTVEDLGILYEQDGR